MTGGFLLAVIAIVMAIIIAAPQYAEPAVGADTAADAAGVVDPSLEPLDVDASEAVVPTSKLPTELRGYGWPVRGGGSIDTYYAADPKGDFEVDGVRIHDGLVITWFEGARVKAAHGGEVVAAGRNWARYVGFDGSLDDVYAKYASGSSEKNKKNKKPRFPLGVVIDDGNGYYSVYTELKDLVVEPGQQVKAGQIIGHMSNSEGKFMMRYRLVRMDGPLMMVHASARARGYPEYARERVDPLAVLNTEAKRMPKMKRKLPKDPPRLSDYDY